MRGELQQGQTRISAAEFQSKFGAKVNENPPRSRVQNPKLKRHKAPALDVASSGKDKSVPRITVRFVGYRVRPLDPDNFAGGCKDCLDGLRHAGIIPDDQIKDIDFQTAQERVAHFHEERTEIFIDIPDPCSESPFS